MATPDFCPNCETRLLHTEFCPNCGKVFDQTPEPVAPVSHRLRETAHPGNEMQMIEPLPSRLQKQLSKMTGPGEQIEVQLNGTFKEALICTNLKVAILKGGLMTGQFFGTNVFQMPYRNIAGVEVKFHLISGYFEISGAGMQNTVKRSRTSIMEALNCVSLNAVNVEKFRCACAFILAHVGDFNSAPDSRWDDPLSAIRRLGELRAQGFLTEAEFTTKKAELLAKL